MWYKLSNIIDSDANTNQEVTLEDALRQAGLPEDKIQEALQNPQEIEKILNDDGVPYNKTGNGIITFRGYDITRVLESFKKGKNFFWLSDASATPIDFTKQIIDPSNIY